tara:strand:+ start:143 stop:598 length:456 start_codon:yes stop_codon:yes gene_type:complete
MPGRDEIIDWSRLLFIGWQWTRIAFFLQMVYFVVRMSAPTDVETLADLINALGVYSLRTLSYGLYFQCLVSLFVGTVAAFVVLLRVMFVEFFQNKPELETNIATDNAHGPTADYAARVTMNDVTMKRVYSGTPDQLAALGLRPSTRNNENR